MRAASSPRDRSTTCAAAERWRTPSFAWSAPPMSAPRSWGGWALPPPEADAAAERSAVRLAAAGGFGDRCVVLASDGRPRLPRADVRGAVDRWRPAHGRADVLLPVHGLDHRPSARLRDRRDPGPCPAHALPA